MKRWEREERRGREETEESGGMEWGGGEGDSLVNSANRNYSRAVWTKKSRMALLEQMVLHLK